MRRGWEEVRWGAPPPSFLRRQEPTRHPPTPSSPPLFPNSSLPPSRGEVRWGVGGIERLPTALQHSNRFFRHSCAPHRHSCAGRNPGVPSAIPAPSIHSSCAPLHHHSCLRRNDGGARVWREESRRCERGLVRGSRRSTPHLTSPLEGGRDELGPLPYKEGGVKLGRAPSVVPACAGMTERTQGWRRRTA